MLITDGKPSSGEMIQTSRQIYSGRSGLPQRTQMSGKKVAPVIQQVHIQSTHSDL